MADVIEMKKVEFWEAVNAESGVYRRKVPGGWLVKIHNIFQVVQDMPDTKLVGMKRKVTMPVNLAIGLTFIPDEKHEWVVE